MRTVAYKLAGDCDVVKSSLPSDHIVEWTYVDLHPEGSLIDFKFLPEVDFNLLLAAQTDDKFNQWKLDKDTKHKIEARKVADQIVADREAQQATKDAHVAEFEEFLAWKKTK